MQPQGMQSQKILIVDDEPVNVMILEQMLQESGYSHVKGLTNSTATLAFMNAYAPDLVVLDLLMPGKNGFEVLEEIRARTPQGVYLPILVVTADVSQTSRRRALTAGATDFLTKPFDEIEVLLRIENLMRTRWQYLLLQDENARLDFQVRERTQALESSNLRLKEAQAEIVQHLAVAAEYRDDDTGRHTRRVGETAYRLAQTLGLEATRCELIRSAAPLHDVGKIGIPDTILLKPGRLTDEEFTIMQRHTNIGSTILSVGHTPLVKVAELIALTHHERWNGCGYPNGLGKNDIPMEGQITGIVDVFDALTHERPYKAAWPVEEALCEIRKLRGIHFSPDVADAFMELPHDELV